MTYIKNLTVIFTCFFLFSPFFSDAQTISYEIKWMNKYHIVDSINDFYTLQFDNSVSLSNDYLPYFSQNINIENTYDINYDYSVKLDNIDFIAFETNELTGVKSLDAVTENFFFQSKLFFARGIPYIRFDLLPIRKNSKSGKYEKVTKFDIIIIKKYTGSGKKEKSYANHSVLSSGTWKKIRISESGIYKITYEQLQSIGISSPENVRVFGNDVGWLPMLVGDDRPDDLIENDILKEGNAIYFYAKGPNTVAYNTESQSFIPRPHYYSEYAFYFITSDYNSGYNNTIKTINSVALPETHTVSDYNAFKVHDVNLLMLDETGRKWYGEAFDITNIQNFTFNFPNLINGSPAKIKTAVASTSQNSYFIFSALGSSKTITIPYVGEHGRAKAKSEEILITVGASDDIIVNLDFHRSSSAIQAWLDYIYINAKCELKFTSGQFEFANFETIAPGNITKYVLSNAGSPVTVWDISDPTKPKKINTEISGTNQTFKFETSNLKEFIAFDKSVYLTPDLTTVENVPNQDLHATSGSVDMIIVTHPDFLPQANEIKSIHNSLDGLNSIVVTQQQVYNEFSCGASDFSAIRDYAKMVFERASGNDTLKYLLLFGDGSYDNRSGVGVNGNYMITYQQNNSEYIGESLVSDDFFGLLDDNEGDNGSILQGLMDIGVGRIPVSDPKQASDYITKIRRYIDPQNYGDWTNQLCFIGDDEDSNIHMRDANKLTKIVEENYPYFNIEKIYFDTYRQYTESGGERYPDVTNAINNRVQKGSLIINYTGHGGEKGLAHERVVTISDIKSWKNSMKLPLFVTATCEFTRFDDYDFISAGEHVFLNANGGAIAMYTTARIAYIYSNYQLSEELYNTIFNTDQNGKRLKLGDIIRLTKNKYNDKSVSIFFLMGDPALELCYASDNNIVTKTINGHPISEIDTLKALSEVTFEGEIQDKHGNKLTGFNGFIYPTIFDKDHIVNTQNNDNQGVFVYETRDNSIYKGKASVVNGNFHFSLIVPKDIALNVDSGKVSYYALHNNTSAKGYSFDFLVGDIAENYEEDNTGPQIDLYMNNESFVSGGMTDKNPKIFAKLYDDHGINTASGGIGHDISGILDGKTDEIIIMNDDYRTEEDTYKSGNVEHYLFNLEPGNHTLKFKAWDVYNNSSEEYLEFLVIEAEKLTIDRLLNYPNPFTTNTDFYFEHNQSGTELDILIQIFTVSGKLVKTIEAYQYAEGYRAGPFNWDGTDDFGNRIGRGVYVYKVKLRSSTGELTEKYEKLLILK